MYSPSGQKNTRQITLASRSAAGLTEIVSPERTKLVNGSRKAFPQNFEAAGQPSTNPGRVEDFGKVESSEPAQRFNLRGRFLGGGRQSLRSLERSEVAGRQGRNEAEEGEVFEGWWPMRYEIVIPHRLLAVDVRFSSPGPKPLKTIEEIRGFDRGRVSVTHRYADFPMGSCFPAFACIRLYEQVGIPVRFGGDQLKNACRWIAPFVGFSSPALRIRAGKVDDRADDGFLLRTAVAAMDVSLATRLYLWCLETLERELDTFTGSLVEGSAQELLFETLPEVLSRLAFKVEVEYLRKAFLLALRFHGTRAVRSRIRPDNSIEPWFRRLFEAADCELLLEWLPNLIRAPLFDERFCSEFFPIGYVWPDPMKDFPVERGREAKNGHANLVLNIREATDWLISRTASESGEGRQRAMMRLITVYDLRVMTAVQERQLGELLWSQQAANNFPVLPDFNVFAFLDFPAPGGTDVVAAIKRYILTLHVDVANEQRLIIEASGATKPFVQIPGRAGRGVEWTSEESKQLYESVRAWWEENREAFERKKAGEAFLKVGLVILG